MSGGMCRVCHLPCGNCGCRMGGCNDPETARTPLETLTLARDYLDSILADSTPGKWEITQDHLTHPIDFWIRNEVGTPVVYDGEGYEGAVCRADAALIVALHATAPAIRELLDQARATVKVWGRDWQRTKDEGRVRSAWFLAAALLSTPHAAQWITEREATQ